ncbi:MAG: arginase family protein [Candidatus Nanoarchaeia archaeon]|jgi:arginase family enzyme
MIDNAVHPQKESDITFIGLNYYGTCSEQGKGPSLIRDSLNSLSSYDLVTGKDAFNELRICDLGDIKASTYESLRKQVQKLSFNNTLIMLGGEHLVSLPVIEQLRPDNVLIFDAHADYYDEYDGKKNSYATVTRRISELVSNVYVAGVRDLALEEASELVNSNVKLISVEDAGHLKLKGSLYVSVDLDVLDPCHCPEVSTPVPLGTNYELLVKVLNKACLNHNLLGLDVVELTAKRKGLSSVNAAGIIMNYLKRRCD